MNTVRIQLFGEFQIFVNGRELPLAPSVKETLALMAAAGGSRITAKGLWKILYSYKGRGYNSVFYTERISDMCNELAFFQVSDIIYSGIRPVRYNRLERRSVSCDYYEMLDGNMPMGEEKNFLPEFAWASAFYQKDWQAFSRNCTALLC